LAYWLTQSGGKIGTVVLLFTAAVIYSLRSDSVKDKIFAFLKTIFVLGGLIGLIAAFNEHVTKQILHQPRPSHIFVIGSNTKIPLDSIYKVSTEKRHYLLKEVIEQDSARFAAIDQRVLEHWVEEAGYSFPSGHSFNVFLLSMIIGWTLMNSRVSHLPTYYFLPFIWAYGVALSRVAIGAHSPLEISVGASAGILLGFLFLHFDHTRKWVTHRK
jgi:phosphatidylglycerophosphatase B